MLSNEDMTTLIALMDSAGFQVISIIPEKQAFLNRELYRTGNTILTITKSPSQKTQE